MNGDGTHNKKTDSRNCNKGETPIEKNIIVVDEFGNEYGATYPKRARGLVKSGRARFIDENRICLACPPDINEITEDIDMSENMNIEATAGTTKYNIDYVLEQLERLHADKEYFSTVVTEIKNIIACGDDDVGTAECAKALGDAVRCRETTNQQLIAFYEKMYDDLKPKAPEPVMQADEAISSMVHNFILQKADYVATHPYEINADEIRHLFEEIDQVIHLMPPI